MTEIVRVSPLSVGKVMAALYFGFSLVLAIPFGLVSLASGSTGGTELLFLLVFPFLYAVFAGVGGVMMGFVYNMAANVVGGLQLTLSE